jgi:hypothetical protein
MADRSQDAVETAIEVRDVETESGEFKGTRAWIDDPHAQAYPGDDHVLVRTSHNEEIEIPAPQGVGEIEQDANDTVLELLIVPPTTGDDQDECPACRSLRNDGQIDLDHCANHRDTDSDGDNPKGEDTETTDPDTESPEDTDDGDE